MIDHQIRKSNNKIRLLVAFDGSVQIMDAIRYISRFFPVKNTEATLFHVAGEVPESFFDLRRNAALSQTIVSVGAWASEVRKNINDGFREAELLLSRQGFAGDAVKSVYHPRQAGVARDILAAAASGYDALVLGRSGLNRIQEVVLGSVVNKILNVADYLPIIVVGGTPDPEKIMIGFDGSEGAMAAVECVCRLLIPSDEREVVLCHVVRSLNLFLRTAQVFGEKEEKAWLDESRKAVEFSMAEAERKLIDAGFHPGCIFKQVLENQTSRAGGLVQAAREGGFGTIVVGRRGLTVVREFNLGRVCRKVLHMGDKRSVWVV